MNTLSEQLTELYRKEGKWEGLMEQLEANGSKDRLQCPFLISLYRSGLKGEEEREKAKKADPCWYLKRKLQNMKNGILRLI